MKREHTPVTIEKIRETYSLRVEDIKARLADFDSIGQRGTDIVYFEEMVFCFFTGGCSARMGINSLESVRSMILTGDQDQLAAALTGVHRYPNARARYIIASREYLQEHCGLKLRNKLRSFGCPQERRDWLARDRGIKGLGYKEASHYLRNIGYKGYAILDKHVLNCLAELKLIDHPKPPNTRSKYLMVEEKVKMLAEMTEIGFDELDLVLWSMKTGVILK